MSIDTLKIFYETAAAGLDGGLLVRTDDVLVLPERLVLPGVLLRRLIPVKAGLLGKVIHVASDVETPARTCADGGGQAAVMVLTGSLSAIGGHSDRPETRWELPGHCADAQVRAATSNPVSSITPALVAQGIEQRFPKPTQTPAEVGVSLLWHADDLRLPVSYALGADRKQHPCGIDRRSAARETASS
jgi:hypothetical protein